MRRRAHDLTQPASPKAERSFRKQEVSTGKHRSPKRSKKLKRKKPERLPPSLRFTETRKGKTTIRRYDRRNVYQMEEIKGKVLDCVRVYTSGGDNSISVRFQDRTSLDFFIDPGFTLDTDYTDWKTGEMRRIKRWPLIHSIGLRL